MSPLNRIHRFGVIAVLSAGVAFVSTASAAEEGVKGAQEPGKQNAPEGKKVRRAGGDEAGGFERLRMGPNGLPMPADRTASIEAKRDLEDAKAQLTTAMAGSSGSSSVAIENELLQTDDYRQAVLDLRRAQADYDNVRRPIFDALRADAYYRELERTQQQRQKVIRNLVMTGRGSFDWLFPHALAALEVRKRMTREEILALSQAPEVEDARERMLVAAAKVRAMKSNRMAELNNSDALRNAKDRLDEARENVRTAQAAYNRALADEAEYEQLRQQYLAELRRTGKAPIAGN